MDSVIAHQIKVTPADNVLRTIMERYAVLLGTRETEARALAAAIAAGPDRPTNEIAALDRIRRAVLDVSEADGAERAMISTWLARHDADRDPVRLPQAGPEATGLPMPAQDLSMIAAREIAAFFGFTGRPRLGQDPAAVRGDV